MIAAPETTPPGEGEITPGGMVDIGTDNATVPVGSTICIDCTVVRGDPTPTTEFSFANRGRVNLLDSRFDLINGSHLCVTVDAVTSGDYTCTATNIAGSDSRTTRLIGLGKCLCFFSLNHVLKDFGLHAVATRKHTKMFKNE